MRTPMKRTQSLTAGSISGSILRFALPLFLGQLLQQFYNMADATMPSFLDSLRP